MQNWLVLDMFPSALVFFTRDFAAVPFCRWMMWGKMDQSHGSRVCLHSPSRALQVLMKSCEQQVRITDK
jgi:hypothetical protein